MRGRTNQTDWRRFTIKKKRSKNKLHLIPREFGLQILFLVGRHMLRPDLNELRPDCPLLLHRVSEDMRCPHALVQRSFQWLENYSGNRSFVRWGDWSSCSCSFVQCYYFVKKERKVTNHILTIFSSIVVCLYVFLNVSVYLCVSPSSLFCSASVRRRRSGQVSVYFSHILHISLSPFSFE